MPNRDPLGRFFYHVNGMVVVPNARLVRNSVIMGPFEVLPVVPLAYQ